MHSHISKKQNAKKKLLCLGSSLFFLSNQFAPIALAADTQNTNFTAPASAEDIQTLRKYYTEKSSDAFIPMNLISQDFKLNEFEVLIMSEIIKQDLVNRASNKETQDAAISDLVDLQNKYLDDYKAIFNKVPEDIVKKADVASQKASSPSSVPAAQSSGTNDGSFGTPTEEGYNEDPERGTTQADINAHIQKYLTPEALARIAKEQGINPDAMEDDEQPYPSGSNYDNQIMQSLTPDQLADNMSLINIRQAPSANVNAEQSNYVNAQNPLRDINLEQLSPIPTEPLQADVVKDNYDMDSLNDLIWTATHLEEQKAKHFFIEAVHNIYYVDEHGEGNVPLDLNRLNDNGKAYRKSITNQYELNESLEIGLGVRVHKALDLVMSIIAKNENGMLGKQGSTFEFGNVLFKFHPERLDPITIQRLNSEGIVIESNGQVIGKRIGKNIVVKTDTKSGTTGIQAGNTVAMYDPENGLSLSNVGSRYFVGFGKLSLDFTSYTLQLTDCKAVQVGYHDNAESLTLLYGKPNDGGKEGWVDNNSSYSQPIVHKGQYEKALFAAQYVTKKLIPNMELSFNFAQAKAKGTLQKPMGALKADTTVYSLFVRSNNPRSNTSYEGEFARAINKYVDLGVESKTNADYLDISHAFSRRLRGSLHLVNIDDNYDTSGLVEDRTGDNLYTTKNGDGKADYLYDPGQRGLDLVLNYTFPKNAALAFGYTRYPRTRNEQSDGSVKHNSKTSYYLSGTKQWSLADRLGNSRGTISLQQRFDYNDVSNKPYTKRSSDTTLSYSGEPWVDGDVSMDAQKIFDNADGDQTRFDLTVAHHFYPADRISVTPKSQYTRKIGKKGYEADSKEMDATTLVNTLTIGYELVPEELTVNVLIAKEKYNIKKSEIDESTGKKIDGESRNVFGAGLGLVWEPKSIAGLRVGVSYRKDKVDYIDNHENSKQDIWDYSVEYSRPLSNNVRATISYDYKTAKDKAKPLYDEVTRTVSIDINAQIGPSTSIQLQHSYEMEYKPRDPSANHKTRSTVLQMTNKF